MKRKVGRPVGSGGNGHHGSTLPPVRCSEALRDLAQESATQHDLALSEWTRRAVLHYLAAGAPTAVPEMADDDDA